jgi:hypothetical protein
MTAAGGLNVSDEARRSGHMLSNSRDGMGLEDGAVVRTSMR